MMSVSRQYKDLQEEVNENRKLILKWKQKYSGAEQELKDIKKEQQGDREELLDTIRTQGYDIKFYRRLARMVMKDEEIAKIKIKSSYDDNADDWIVPPFILRAREVTLPSLKKTGYDVME